MADDVTIKFTADVSDLQRGMQQAASAVESTTGALRSGAARINTSFATLSQASARNADKRISAEKAVDDAIHGSEQKQLAEALESVKQRSAGVRQEAQAGQISRQEELASLLALEGQRERIEVRQLEAHRNASQTQAADDKTTLNEIEELAKQAAVRRQAIEHSVNDAIVADYRGSFERIGQSVSSSIMGMIRGHERLRQAAQKVALSIIQSFVQARVKMVADWAAGLAAQVTMATTSEAAKTAAVASGTAARSGLESTASTATIGATISAVMSSISASAAETFAGIFGFLSPVMGPAAAGPAAAGEATVMAATGIASHAIGSWSLPNDMLSIVHKGEMIVPAAATPWAQSLMANAASSGSGGGDVHVHHATNFNVSAMDTASVKQFFKDNGKHILGAINEGVRTGSHLGLSKLGKI